MEWLLDILKERTADDWLLGANSIHLQELTRESYLELKQFVKAMKK